MMRKLLLAVAACLLVGCDTTSPRDGVLVTAATSRSSISPGQALSINLTIYNRGDEDVQLGIDECVPPYEILNERGDVVGPGARMCSLALMAPIIVAAGGSTTYTTTWAGDSTGIGPADGPNYLSAGTYSIRPRVLVAENGGGFVYGNPLPITVTTPIAIVIRP
jgi:hypothetical protein